MPKYTALTPIKHDGKRYAVGALLELSKVEAEALPEGTVEVPRIDDIAARKAADKSEAARKQRADAAEKAELERLAALKAEEERLAAEKTTVNGDGSKQD